MKDIATAIVESEHARISGNNSFKEGNFDECLNHYLHSLKLDSKNFKTLNNLGVVHERTGKTQQAIEYYRRSCTLIGAPSTETTTHFENLARASGALGEITIAIWAYEKALEVPSKNQYNIAIRYLETLNKTQHSSTDNKTIETLEKIIEVPKIDRQLISNEYFRLLSFDQDLSKSSNAMEIASILKKYKLVIPLLTSCLNTNSLIEQKLSILANEFENIAPETILSLEHTKLFNALKVQSCLSGGIQILTSNKDHDYIKTQNLMKSNLITTAINESQTVSLPIKSFQKSSQGIPRDVLRRFYEANPYPFWESRPHHTPAKLEDYFSRLGLDPRKISSHNNRILVAGCGTGRHAIQLALSYPDTQVIGIDVSLSSLRYANQQKKLHGVNNVKFVHCSIYDIAKLKIKFKIIECIGVIHHLRKKALVIDALLSALDNDGVIKIGLYSKQARAPLQTAKKLCRIKSITYKPENIIQIRKAILSSSDTIFSTIINSSDFYSRQGCMDLLFNPYEDPFTIRRIYNMTVTHKLDFCGFDCKTTSTNPPPLIKFNENQKLKKLLNQWHLFEINNPNTFSEMYLFWIKPRKTHGNLEL